MNCGVSLTSSGSGQNEQAPQPMEGMSDGDRNDTGISRGYKRAFREEGESQGNLSSGMSIDHIAPCDWDAQVQHARSRKSPCVLMKGTNPSRALNIASIQNLTGE